MNNEYNKRDNLEHLMENLEIKMKKKNFQFV